jgi:predicted metal-dependent enzyme (double-stranded beta helix superfamily)
MQTPSRDDAYGIDLLIDGLNKAVKPDDVSRITCGVKEILTDLVGRKALRLPDDVAAPRPGTYARRLLHRDRERSYTVVAMIWGPGQHTELHDHAGMWCVECVVQGVLDITQYDMVERGDDRCRFAVQQTVRAGVGDAGCLIPPFEYHAISNPLPDRTSITLHVYGGEMERCTVYLPRAEGWWEPAARQLRYN